MTEPAAVAKRRGRPPKEPRPAATLTDMDIDRLMKDHLGRQEFLFAKQSGTYANLVEQYREQLQGALEWEQQEPCAHCHARPGHNPLTGVEVRFWDAASRDYIDGHRAGCLTLAKKP